MVDVVVIAVIVWLVVGFIVLHVFDEGEPAIWTVVKSMLDVIGLLLALFLACVTWPILVWIVWDNARKTRQYERQRQENQN